MTEETVRTQPENCGNCVHSFFDIKKGLPILKCEGDRKVHAPESRACLIWGPKRRAK
jgi:hypothetical protein